MYIVYTLNPYDLYFWRSTPQNKAFSNQNKGHLGSRYTYTLTSSFNIPHPFVPQTHQPHYHNSQDTPRQDQWSNDIQIHVPELDLNDCDEQDKTLTE